MTATIEATGTNKAYDLVVEYQDCEETSSSTHYTPAEYSDSSIDRIEYEGIDVTKYVKSIISETVLWFAIETGCSIDLARK